MKKIIALISLLVGGLIYVLWRPPQYIVEYRVYGDPYHEIIYTNYQGKMERSTNRVGNWNYKFKTYNPDFWPSVTAFLNGYGTIRVEIWINGKKIRSSESHGAYVGASASCCVSDEPVESDGAEKGF